MRKIGMRAFVLLAILTGCLICGCGGGGGSSSSPGPASPSGTVEGQAK